MKTGAQEMHEGEDPLDDRRSRTSSHPWIAMVTAELCFLGEDESEKGVCCHWLGLL
jgi:hypothetical protein